MENKIIDRIIDQDEKKFLYNEIESALNTYANKTTFDLQYTSSFINRLVDEFIKNKKWLVDLLKKAPTKEEAKEKGLNFWWDPDLYGVWVEAVPVEPDYNLIFNKMLGLIPRDKWTSDVIDCLYFFVQQEEDKTKYIDALDRVAPGAYAPGKKPSRILKALYSALDVVDNTAGSVFQKEFAAIADMIRPDGLTENVLISVNPAHMLTMSNPKHRSDKAPFMVSCHSLDSDYDYKNGCVGYARDSSSFLLLKASSEHDQESYCVSKTMRQLYAYDGYYLLQSRLYISDSGRSGGYGGTDGAQSVNVIYRQVVQKVLAYCEDVANLWKTIRIAEDYQYDDYICVDGYFAGYHDWEYSDFDCRLCIIQSKDVPTDHYLSIGAVPMCFVCGEDFDADEPILLCKDCSTEYGTCGECGDLLPVDDLYAVWRNGGRIHVCQSCRDENYEWCERCEEYYFYSEIIHVQGVNVCTDCVDTNCRQCSECGEYHFDNPNDLYKVWKSLDSYEYLCEECLQQALDNETVKWCESCERYVFTNGEESCVYCGVVFDSNNQSNEEE